MLASSFLDPVLGLDVHWEMVPIPAPTPLPIPNPFTGIIFDPLGLAVGLAIGNAIGAVLGEPFKGPVIYWGVTPGTNTGTEAKHIPGHILIPPGTAWAPVPRTPPVKIHPGEPPSAPSPVKPYDDATCIFGSKTVMIMGSNAVRESELLLSCSEPVRLPSSAVIAIAKGAPIVIGGPSSLDLFAAILASLRTRFISDCAQSLISQMKPSRFRSFLQWAACKLTGHPVDVATGRVLTWFTDAELPGPLPLKVERFYSSAFASRPSPLGYGWSFSLDQAVWRERGKVVYLAEDGREIEFDTFNFPSHELPMGEEVRQPFDRLTLRRKGTDRWEIEHPDGVVQEFAPVQGGDPARALIQQTRSSCGFHQITFHYDEQGCLAWVRDSGGRVIQIEYDAWRRIVAVKLPQPNAEGWYVHNRFEYDDDGDLVRVTDALGASWKFEYVTHLLTRDTDRNGLSFYFAYDGFGEDAWCIRTWGDGGIYDHVIHYDKKNHRTFVTNSLGHRTQYHLNLANLIIKIVDPRGGETTYEYDPQTLQRTKEIDSLGNETAATYDARGNLTKLLQPDGSFLQFEYDDKNRPTKAIDPLDGAWVWEYDSRGRLAADINPLNETTQYKYEDGYLAAIIDAGGGVTTFGYDKQGNVTTSRAPDGGVTQRRYDYLGRPDFMRGPTNNIEEHRFDLLGRVIKFIDSDGNHRTTKYDAEGSILHSKDNDQEIRFSYSGRGCMVERVERDTVLRFSYDTEEQLLAITNEDGNVYRFDRDENGKTKVEYGFDGGKFVYVRDTEGRPIQVRRPSGQTTKYTYDWANNVRSIEYPDGTAAHYAYRADGELVEATNPFAVVKFERDALGKVTKEWQGDHWIESSYDRLGERTFIRSSLGTQMSIQRNRMGDVTNMRYAESSTARTASWEVGFERDRLGLELARVLPGGIRSRWERDALGRPVRHSLANAAGILRDIRYKWEIKDRLSQFSETPDGTTRFGHDTLGNLIWAQYPDSTRDLRIPDRVGNLYRTTDRSDRAYAPSGQVIWAEKDGHRTAYEYDADGNLASRTSEGQRYVYEWFGSGWLKSARSSNGGVVEFAYDALGRRISKMSSQRTVSWVWDGDSPLHEFIRPKTARPTTVLDYPDTTDPMVFRQRSEIPFPGRAFDDETHRSEFVTWLFEPETLAPLAKFVGDRRYSVITDDLGTPVTMLDEAGRQVWASNLDVYGKPREPIVGRPEDVPFRYPGFYEDEETGLCYNRFRYYDPDTGGYISKDPFLTGGGFTLYGYVDDPLVATDIFGLVSGGSYSKVRRSRRGGEVHHMPANSVSPLSHGKGPAIWMTRRDHRKTSSWGSSHGARRYRAAQRRLLRGPNPNYYEAILMDILDIKDPKKGFGNKYDDAIREMLEHCRQKSHLTSDQVDDIKRRCGL